MQEYIDIGLERIQKLSEDSLKTRPIYQKIYEPSGRDSVSKYPVEWLEKRLHEIEEMERIVQEDNIRNEIKILLITFRILPIINQKNPFLIGDGADENMQRDGSIVECYRKNSYKIL